MLALLAMSERISRISLRIISVSLAISSRISALSAARAFMASWRASRCREVSSATERRSWFSSRSIRFTRAVSAAAPICIPIPPLNCIGWLPMPGGGGSIPPEDRPALMPSKISSIKPSSSAGVRAMVPLLWLLLKVWRVVCCGAAVLTGRLLAAMAWNCVSRRLALSRCACVTVSL